MDITMSGILLRFSGIAFCAVMCAYLIASIFRRGRLLNRQIAEFKAEQEALKASGKVIDPYAALAELYAEDKGRRRR